MYREEITNRWLRFVTEKEKIMASHFCCGKGSFSSVSGVQCCPMYSGSYLPRLELNSTFFYVESATDRRVSKTVADNSINEQSITFGITTCRRIDLFLRTMPKLLDLINGYPDSMVHEVESMTGG